MHFNWVTLLPPLPTHSILSLLLRAGARCHSLHLGDTHIVCKSSGGANPTPEGLDELLQGLVIPELKSGENSQFEWHMPVQLQNMKPSEFCKLNSLVTKTGCMQCPSQRFMLKILFLTQGSHFETENFPSGWDMSQGTTLTFLEDRCGSNPMQSGALADFLQ